jgi:hypothetical protein
MFTICDNGDNRQMTAKEIAEQEAFLQDMDKVKSKEASRAEAKAAVLERLGITAEEAALLLA